MANSENNAKPTLDFETEETENGGKIFELSDGRECEVHPGKGKHMKQAQRIAGDDPSGYMPALMSQLVDIDGKAVPGEEFDELPLKDYMKITQVFNEVNL